MVVFQAFRVGNCRSERRSAFALSPFSNPFLLFGVGGSLLLHVPAMRLAPTQRLLRLQPLELETWLGRVGIALSVVVVVELHKLVRREPAGARGAD
jgi:Ca2+-transporting ATPase